MKKIGLLFVLSFLILSCSNDDDNSKNDVELIGNWQLTAIYSDPGDGSGDFQNVTSNKIIEFETNGTFQSNGSICDISIASDTPTSGTYSVTDSTLNSTDCLSIAGFSTNFELTEGNLIISYPCIEACQEKYIKIQ